MDHRIPSTGKPMYKDHLQGARLSHDPNNLIRLYEILLANSFGNRDYITNKYKNERKPPAPKISANLFANIHQKQQNEFIIQHQPVFHVNPYAPYYVPYVPNHPPAPTFHPHEPHNVIRRPIPKYPTAIKCPTCGKSFYSQLYLEVHQMLHLSKQHQEFVCKICNEIFPTSTTLDIHKRLHEGLEPLKLCISPRGNVNNLKSQESPQPLELLKKSSSPCDSLKKEEESSKYEKSAQPLELLKKSPSPCDSLKKEESLKYEESAQPVELLKKSASPCDSPKKEEENLKYEESAQPLELLKKSPSPCDSLKKEEESLKYKESAQPVELLKKSASPCDSPKKEEENLKYEESAQTASEIQSIPPIRLDSPKDGENILKSEDVAPTAMGNPSVPPISCDSLENDENRLKSQKTAEMNGKITFKCPICNKVFKYYTSYKRHFWIHERCKQDRFYCALCKKSYSWKQNLEAHIKKTHLLS